MSTNVVLFTSLKGGCGKSTVCANLACALSSRQKRVLLISLDKYNSSLDLLFGCESFLFDVADFPERQLSEICLPIDGCDGLFLALSMPYAKKEEDVRGLIESAKSSGEYDFVFIDKGASHLSDTVRLAEMSDKVLVISTQADDSLRSAELLGCLLADNGIDDDKISLVLNSFYTDVASVGYFKGISTIIAETKIRLLGIVPFSDELCAKQTVIKNIKDGDVINAFSNIAGRLIGEDRKILDFLPAKNRRIILNNECSGGNRI